jgi:hypothetical protein
MRPPGYPNSLLLNLRRLPATREGGLPTAQDLQELTQASLFYDAPVVIANLTTTSLCAFALYPEFILRLRDHSSEDQSRLLHAMKMRNTTSLGKAMTTEKLVKFYRNLITPGERDEGVMWLNILPLKVTTRESPTSEGKFWRLFTNLRLSD